MTTKELETLSLALARYGEEYHPRYGESVSCAIAETLTDIAYRQAHAKFVLNQ